MNLRITIDSTLRGGWMKSPRDYINEYNQLHKACDMLYRSVAARAGISDCAFWILYIVQNTKGICKQSDILAIVE